MNSFGRRAFSFAAAALAAGTVLLSASVSWADYASTVLSDNPLGYWRLAESGGATAGDASGNGRDLTYSLFTPAGYGQTGAIVGDADTALRLIPNPPNVALGSPSSHPTIVSPNTTDFGFALGESFSLEYWIKVAPGNTSTAGAGIITKGYDSAQSTPWYLSRYNDADANTVDFFLRDATNGNRSVRATTNVTDDRWHHVVGVYDSAAAEIRIFVDGAQEGATGAVAVNPYGANAQPLTIGNHFNRGLDGLIDEVAIYGSALNAVQVASHYFEGSGATPPAKLDIDFGSSANAGAGPGGIQAGFFGFEAAEGGGNPAVTRSFPSSLGASNTVDVTLGGYTHFRDYAAVTGDFAGASPLLSDMTLRNADGTQTMTLGGLKPGVYEITTFHHSTQFGGGSLNINLTDANGAGQSVAAALAVSSGAAPTSVSTATINFVSDGSPVSLDIVGGTSSQHAAFNGFRLRAGDLRERIPVLAIDINDRGAPDPNDPNAEQVTQAGFSEFLLGGTENDDLATPTTRGYGPYSVTLSPSNANGLGDRRRTEPVDAGFFTDGQLLRDFVFARGPSVDDGLDVLVNGLKPGQLYEVTIWSFDDLSNSVRISDWFANGSLVKDDYSYDGSATPPSPAFNDVYSFKFLANADAVGDLLVSARQDGGIDPGVFLNAMSIAEVVPEPSSFALVAIGLVALLPLRRYRRRHRRQDVTTSDPCDR